MPSEENDNIAVLIDAENVDPSFADQIFSYARSLGLLTVREIYGSGISLNEWSDAILRNTIHTNFTLRPSRFKNSSDIALVIGAMEILAASRNAKDDSQKISAVVIASSDSDFSPLAVHLRGSGIDVIGMGEPGHINPMWPRACTDFIPLMANGPMMRRRDPEPIIPAPASVKSAAEPVNRAAVRPAAELAPAPATKAPQESPSATAPDAGTQPTKESGSKLGPESSAKPAAEKKRKGRKKAAAPAPEENQAAPAAATSPVPEKPEKKKPLKAQVAANHAARVEIIRAFIAGKIAEQNGRLKSGQLFRDLTNLPDYQYDQQRSRRNPTDYLKKQYGAWFDFEAGDNGSCWITLKPEAETVAEKAESAAEPAVTENGAAAEAEPVAATETTEPPAEAHPEGAPEKQAETAPAKKHESSRGKKSRKSAGDKAKATKQDRKGSAKQTATSETDIADVQPQAAEPAESTAVPEPAPALANATEQAAKTADAETAPAADESEHQRTLLLNAGIPEEHAARVAGILSTCRNLRDSYNRLRQEFGNMEGKRYHELIKKAFAPSR